MVDVTEGEASWEGGERVRARLRPRNFKSPATQEVIFDDIRLCDVQPHRSQQPVSVLRFHSHPARSL